MKKIFLIDGMAILYRAHYAMINNPLTTQSGVHTSAIFGFFNIIFKILKEENPDYFLIAMDSKKPTFRHERYAEYKANRKQMPVELQEQIPIFYDILDKSNISMFKLDGFEADDILGTIVSLNRKKNIQQYIVSGDKDLMQLVNENTFVYSPGNNFQPKKIYTEEKVIDKWGVHCKSIIDYLALVGDSSDNVPGVPGVGPKTAVKLLDQFDYKVENIYKLIENIKNDRLREKLILNKDNALLSKELVTIDNNVPINFSMAQTSFDLIDFSSMQKELNDLEIYAFDNTVKKYIYDDKLVENKEVKKNYKVIQNEKELIELSNRMTDYEYIAIDLETTDINPNIAEIVGVSIAFNINQAYYIPFISPNSSIIKLDLFVRKIISVLISDKYKIIGQNIKYDLLILKRYGVEFENIYFDTMLAESLISPEKNNYKLDDLSLDYLAYKMQPIEDLIGDKKNTQISMSEVPIEKICFYACEDADITLQIFYKQLKLIDSMDLANLFYKIEMPLVNILLDIEYNGIYINQNYIKKLSVDLKKKIIEISEIIYSMANKQFNINSPKQLSEVLFDDLQLKPIKKRKELMII